MMRAHFSCAVHIPLEGTGVTITCFIFLSCADVVEESASKNASLCCLVCIFDIPTLLFQQFANSKLQIALHRFAHCSEWSPSCAFWRFIENKTKFNYITSTMGEK